MSTQCRFCNKDIPFGLNGNRRYCDEDCYNYAKLERTKDKYANNKITLAEINRSENLLKAFYNIYGDKPFDINILRSEKMNWNIRTDSKVLDGINYQIVGLYGYSAFQNKTIQIVKF